MDEAIERLRQWCNGIKINHIGHARTAACYLALRPRCPDGESQFEWFNTLIAQSAKGVVPARAVTVEALGAIGP